MTNEKRKLVQLILNDREEMADVLAHQIMASMQTLANFAPEIALNVFEGLQEQMDLKVLKEHIEYRKELIKDAEEDNFDA